MKILLFGGSFDPVHIGHVNILKQTMRQKEFDLVLVMPTAVPGHKAGCRAPFPVRLHWASEAFGRLGGTVEVSDYEYRQEGRSYSYLTLRHLREIYPSADIYFLIGEDSAKTLPTWRNWQELASMCTFLVLARDNDDTSDLKRAVEIIRQHSPRTEYIKAPVIELSSTEIRRMAAQKKDVSSLVPRPAADEIARYSVYSEDDYERITGTARLLISIMLREKRANHTYNVARYARKLAEIHGEDIRKANVAGLLHDIMKQTDEDTQRRYTARVIGEEKAMSKNLSVIHGFARARFMRSELGIEDEDVLNAVMNHTCGRAGMSRLEKIIYLADMLSPERNYPEKEGLVRLAEKDLDTAMEAALSESISWIESKGAELDSDSVSRLSYFIELNEEKKGPEEKGFV